jgi:hypothetical protein
MAAHGFSDQRQTGRPVAPPRRGHLADLAAAWASSVREPLPERDRAATYAAQFAPDDGPVGTTGEGDLLDRAGMGDRSRD